MANGHIDIESTMPANCSSIGSSFKFFQSCVATIATESGRIISIACQKQLFHHGICMILVLASQGS